MLGCWQVRGEINKTKQEQGKCKQQDLSQKNNLMNVDKSNKKNHMRKSFF